MNLKEAAQQALEAMEVWRDSLFDENALPGWRFSVLGEKAITALSAALADSTRQESQQVDPVGYFSINSYGNWEQNESGCGTPLYEAPPKRKPLTDEEMWGVIGSLADTRLAGPLEKLIRATERAHGIGGEE